MKPKILDQLLIKLTGRHSREDSRLYYDRRSAWQRTSIWLMPCRGPALAMGFTDPSSYSFLGMGLVTIISRDPHCGLKWTKSGMYKGEIVWAMDDAVSVLSTYYGILPECIEYIANSAIESGPPYYDIGWTMLGMPILAPLRVGTRT